MKIIVVSYFTNDWDYPLYASKLRKDCERLGLRYHIEEKDTSGQYVKNCNIKPFFIRECLEKFKSPILWMDADATLVSLPKEIEQATDFDIIGNTVPDDRNRIHVGSIVFNYTDSVLEFLNEWCDLVQRSIDDAAFNAVWGNMKHKMKFTSLPDECFKILPWPHSAIPENSFFVHRLSNSIIKQNYKKTGL